MLFVACDFDVVRLDSTVRGSNNRAEARAIWRLYALGEIYSEAS